MKKMIVWPAIVVCSCFVSAFAQNVSTLVDKHSGTESMVSNGIPRAEAVAVVTRAYRDILRREPDPQGLESHVQSLSVEDHNEAWLRSVLANSREARERVHSRNKRWRFVAGITVVTCTLIFLGIYGVRRLKRRSLVLIIFINVVLTVAGLAAVIGIYEWHLRRTYGKYDFLRVGNENPDFRTGQKNIPQIFTPDPDLGFRPICSPSNYYNAFGTLQNEYSLVKRPHVNRLLFIGDSVTHRGQLIKALKALYGEDRFEYWNAGVEAYNTVQEVGFYRKYNRTIQPDHVILTMVCNDMETTPLAFMNSGKLVLVAPSLPRNQINAWLFQHCFIYRRWVGQRVKRNSELFRERIRSELIANLRSLHEELREEGVKFTVLVLPLLVSPDKCPKEVTAIQRDFVGIVSNLNIRSFDLAEPVAAAVGSGVLRGWGDTCHPNYESALLIAQWLKDKEVFDEP